MKYQIKSGLPVAFVEFKVSGHSRFCNEGWSTEYYEPYYHERVICLQDKVERVCVPLYSFSLC